MSSTTPCNCQCSEEVPESVLFERLDEVLKEYKKKPGGLIPTLQMAQGIFGYLPEKVIKYISAAFDKPYSEVAGVVSFYSFFSTQPRGRNLVRVCLGTACYVRGGKDVLEAFKKRLGIDVGETTPDQCFSLEIARCFGACGLAPAVSINDDIHQQVKASKINDILELYEDQVPVPVSDKEEL